MTVKEHFELMNYTMKKERVEHSLEIEQMQEVIELWKERAEDKKQECLSMRKCFDLNILKDDE